MSSKRGRRYSRDYTDEELRAQARELESAVTIPVNVEIRADHRVFDLGEAEKILRQAKKIVLQDCGCRADKRNCDAPLHVCVGLEPAEDYVTKFAKYNPCESTLKEALNALRMSHEAGLVHMAYTMKGDDHPTVICSCCPCCCHTLGGLLRHGIATQVLTSKFVAKQNPEKCLSCGRCVDRCVFGARELDNGELEYDQSRCFGCGLCVSTCPALAITLVPRH
jgi:Pyruvate/2-oxoacid:ferredoxin oxidoreductase delta subunit